MMLARWKVAVLIVAAMLSGAGGRQAQAQWVVLDPANLAQSIAQVANMVEQISNQARQIEQASAMLAQNPLQISPEISRSIAEVRAVFSQAEGLSFEAHRLSAQLRTLYPDAWERYDLGAVLAQSDRWLAESRVSIQRAMDAEARAAASIEGAQGQIDRALRSSSSAEGQTGAVQAGNQLLGVQAGQLTEIHALLVAQGRALQTERMERLAREERAREIQRRAFPTGSSAAPEPARSAF
jgi:P-type conjugative transfer protein TrbJ